MRFLVDLSVLNVHISSKLKGVKMSKLSRDLRIAEAVDEWASLVQTYMSDYLGTEISSLSSVSAYDPSSFGAYGKEEEGASRVPGDMAEVI
jgi:hypothetical protein